MMVDNREYRTVVLGGLLHDVGKLLQRGTFGAIDIKGKHPAISANFVSAFTDVFSQICDPSLLRTLVQKHHESPYFESDLNVSSITDEHIRTLASLVSLADNLSSSERGERSKTYQDYKETPLASVLERINAVGSETPGVRFHSGRLLNPEKLRATFPAKIQVYDQGELTQLIKDFGEDFQNLFKSGKSVVDARDYDCVLTHLYSILAKYTWCLPSDTQEVFPDVSLFDHLRTTAAIASCLYLYHSSSNSLKEKNVRAEDVQRFLLVTGDISGIQNYIFDIATGGVGGIARRLRARSLYVQLCCEVASHLVLRKLGLPIVIHTLLNSGGHFYLLLPNTEEVGKSVLETQKLIDTWFLQELNGELALNLTMVPLEDEGFKTEKDVGAGFGAVMKASNAQLDAKKKNRFISVLQDSHGWQETAFGIPLTYQGEESCQSCRKFPQEKEGLCSHCYLDRDIGKMLPEAKYFAFYEDKRAGDVEILGYSVSMNAPAGNAQPYLVVKINDTGLSDMAAYPATFRYITRTVPHADNCAICREEGSTIATFECLANRAGGDSLLGFLKMDVDNLGETVIFGLKPNDSISRVSTMSRMFDLFFSGWVENLAQRSKAIYTIFSGGDDLFLVGPWDLILETAENIRDDFVEYTNNPKLTISAGVVINRHDYPIAAAADEVNTAPSADSGEIGHLSAQIGHPVKGTQGVALEWL
jgi:CRISPR-associated protein Csm1